MFKYTSEQLAQIDVPLVKKWLAALESGQYKQTRDTLVSGNGQGFCCLGVVCKVEGSGKVRRNGSLSGTANAFWFKASDSRFWEYAKSVTDYPPSFILERIGISQMGNRDTLNVRKYASLNDEEGYTFKQIAAVLRADYAAAGLDLGEGIPGGIEPVTGG